MLMFALGSLYEKGCRIKVPRDKSALRYKKYLQDISPPCYKQIRSAIHQIYLKQFATYIQLFESCYHFFISKFKNFQPFQDMTQSPLSIFPTRQGDFILRGFCPYTTRGQIHIYSVFSMMCKHRYLIFDSRVNHISGVLRHFPGHHHLGIYLYY